MIRRVAFRKAIVAGALGAAAWEATARPFVAGGFRVFDIVHTLGSLMFGPAASAWLWWPAGMALHCMVGAVWAIFYAYFFWSTFDVRPVLQGVLFSMLPAALAGLVMVPELDLMHSGMSESSGPFAVGLGPGGPILLLVGHIVYGAVLGSIYVRPVGYPVGKRIPLHG